MATGRTCSHQRYSYILSGRVGERKMESDGVYCYKYDNDIEQFEECYQGECPAYVKNSYNGKIVMGCKFVNNNVPIN